MARGIKNGGLKLFLVYLFLSFFLFFLDQKGWLDFFHRLVDPPILAAEEKIKSLSFLVSQSFSLFESSKQKDKEIQELQGQLRQMAVDQNQFSTCLEENEHFRKLLGAPLSPKWKFLDAKVIGVAEKMRLNRGRKDGVEEGMTVISENILVGRVVSVGEVDSLVQLPDDPNSKIPVVVKRSRAKGVQARGLLVGQFGEKLILDRVLQNEDIQKGDLVITSGEEDPPSPEGFGLRLDEVGLRPDTVGETSWLADLVIGQIKEVLPRTAEVYQKAVVSPLVDYRSLSIVFVILR